MKNIYVLPTSQPSRLVKQKYDTLDRLCLADIVTKRTEYKRFNIYINSDEEIKKGDWVYSEARKTLFKVKSICNTSAGYLLIEDDVIMPLEINEVDCKKIILTTDQDLIKNGVQSIDDEFLQWFVKNPSCENVEVEEEDYSQKCRECGETVKRGYSCKKGCFMRAGNFIPTDENIKYKIIIPKEKPKQETLEEVAEIYASHSLKEERQKDLNMGFKEGAKWQQERSYSEEDMKQAFRGFASGKSFKDWFEQFKNK